MNRRRSLALLLATMVVTGASAQVTISPDIFQYGVGKTKNHVQSGPAAPGFVDYTFNAFVDLRAGGTLAGATLSGPLVGGQEALTLNSSGLDFRSASFDGDPTTAKGNLNSNFRNTDNTDPTSKYRLQIDVGTPGTPEFDVVLPLGGDLYPTAAPTFTLDSGNWSNDVYVVDPNNLTNIGWNLAGYNGETDVVIFDIRSSTGMSIFDQRFTGTLPTGIPLPALAAGESYTMRLTHARLASLPDLTSVPGAEGVAFYAVETTFNVQAIPEPSTYALLLAGLGLIYVTVRRRAAR